jgi:hypothetical protein
MGSAAVSASLGAAAAARGRPLQHRGPQPVREQLLQFRRIGNTRGEPAALKKAHVGPGGMPLVPMPTIIGARDLLTVRLQALEQLLCRVGPEPYIYGVYTVLFAGKSPNIRSYTVYIYGSGQPYYCAHSCFCPWACSYVWWCCCSRL